VLAVIIFDLSITATNGLGIILTLAGGAWYSNVQLNESRKKSKLLGGESLLGVNDKNDNELSNIKTQK
jgi:hypothetical protein